MAEPKSIAALPPTIYRGILLTRWERHPDELLRDLDLRIDSYAQQVARRRAAGQQPTSRRDRRAYALADDKVRRAIDRAVERAAAAYKPPEGENVNHVYQFDDGAQMFIAPDLDAAKVMYGERFAERVAESQMADHLSTGQQLEDHHSLTVLDGNGMQVTRTAGEWASVAPAGWFCGFD